MPMKRCVVRVDPQGKAMVVDILDTSGVSVTAYESSEFAAARLTLPMTITGQTDFCLPSPGPYDVSCKVGGTEVANAGAAKRVQAGDTPVRVVPDWERELAGADSAASGGVPLPTWLAGTVGGAPNVLAQSPDGKQFYPQLPLRADINAGAGDPSVTRALGYNGSEWLFSLRQTAVTPGLNLLLRSTDGYSWAYIANPFSNADGDSISCFCWTGTKWFAGSGRAATEQRVIMSSVDGGLHWTTEPSPFDGGVINGISWDGQHLVAVGQDAAGNHVLMTSTGNGTWTARATPFDSPGAFNAAYSVVSNGSQWVVQGYDAVPSTVTVITAAAGDITTWTGRASPFDTNGAGNGPYASSSLWDGTKFWLAAPPWSPDPQLMSSTTDGTTWTSEGTPLGAGVAVTAMGWDGDLLVISGLDSAKTTFLTAWSADGGTTWHKVYPPDPYWSLTSKRQPNAIPAIV